MELLQHPIVTGALAGFLAATAVDFQAFRAFKSFQEFRSYSWGLAAFRAVQGIVLGVLAALGIGAL